jgi:hypothetical protein
MASKFRPAVLLAMLATASQAQPVDPVNPTCPPILNWPYEREMRLSVRDVEGGRQVLVAEGAIDETLPPRFEEALKGRRVSEVWLSSPGGNARAGNAAGLVLRRLGVPTRIPAGWACAGSCAFLFMGGITRTVEPGGLFIATMFTHTGDREAIRRATAEGEQATADLMTDIARSSARVAIEDLDYVMRMGVSRALLPEIFYRQSAVARDGSHPTWHCLTQDELRRYNVVNS